MLSAEYVLVVVAGEQNQLGPPSGNVGSSGGAGCEKPLKRLLCAGHRGARQARPCLARPCLVPPCSSRLRPGGQGRGAARARPSGPERVRPGSSAMVTVAATQGPARCSPDVVCFSFSFFFFLHFQGLKIRPRVASLLFLLTGGVRVPETRYSERAGGAGSISSARRNRRAPVTAHPTRLRGRGVTPRPGSRQ